MMQLTEDGEVILAAPAFRKGGFLQLLESAAKARFALRGAVSTYSPQRQICP